MNVLLDLDGTLTDPRTGFVACINYALATLGHATHPEEQVASYIGPPLEETLTTLLGTEHEHQLTRAVSLYRERYADTGIFECVVYGGIPDILQILHARGARLILATSKPRMFALRILAHFSLQQLFAAVYGSELDGTRAHKAQLLSYLLQEEQLQPESAVMVGDRAHDIRAAQANGIQSIGVLWGYGSRHELEEAGAHMVIERPIELVDVWSSLQAPVGEVPSVQDLLKTSGAAKRTR